MLKDVEILVESGRIPAVLLTDSDQQSCYEHEPAWGRISRRRRNEAGQPAAQTKTS